MCLREIKNCNLFVGCYGERYGSCIDIEEVSELKKGPELLEGSKKQSTENLDSWITDEADDDYDDIFAQIRSVSNKGTDDKAELLRKERDRLVASLEEKNEVLKNSFDMAVTEFPWIDKYREKSMTDIEFRMV